MWSGCTGSALPERFLEGAYRWEFAGFWRYGVQDVLGAGPDHGDSLADRHIELELTDAETSERLKLQVDEDTRSKYVAAFDEYAGSLQKLALRNNGRYVGISTAMPIEGDELIYEVNGVRYLDQFVNLDCQDGYAVQGQAPASRFLELAPTFRRSANSLQSKPC